LDLHLAPGEITIRGGAAQLMRLLLNLIKNAVEAMEEVGVLTVKTETLYLDEPMHGYATIERGEYARVDIGDTGCGIPEEALAHIFEPFFTTKKTDRKRGTGLGLPVVHSVVEDHNGYIDVVSSPGRGSTFSLYFPLDRAGAVAAEAVSTIEEGHGESVLVVDDDPLQRRIAQTSLERVGYRVSVMESGEAAVAHIKDHPADIVILDMVMDGIDGAETLRRIRELYPEQPAMILTGYATSDRAQAALGLGQCQLLAKPIQASALTQAIRAMWSGRNGVVSTPPSSPHDR
jgi:CheY-like chemotaxis protein